MIAELVWNITGCTVFQKYQESKEGGSERTWIKRYLAEQQSDILARHLSNLTSILSVADPVNQSLQSDSLSMRLSLCRLLFKTESDNYKADSRIFCSKHRLPVKYRLCLITELTILFDRILNPWSIGCIWCWWKKSIRSFHFRPGESKHVNNEQRPRTVEEGWTRFWVRFVSIIVFRHSRPHNWKRMNGKRRFNKKWCRYKSSTNAKSIG